MSSPEETLNSLVIIELSPSTEKATLDWFVQRLQLPQIEGGAGLIVHVVESVLHDGSVLLHVGATLQHLEEGAEDIGIKKRRLDTNELRAYYRDDKESFEPLSSADLLSVIKHDLRNLRATPQDGQIPGLGDKAKPLYHGKSICRRLESSGVVTQVFPLHDAAALADLKKGMLYYLPSFLGGEKWPLQGIRDYFGEMIALYFSFLRYFALALLPVILVALPYRFFEGRKDFEAFFIFAIFNLIWATLLIEIWKRKSARHAFEWGTLGMEANVYEEPRGGYHGPLKKHPVTGRYEPHASSTTRYLKMVFVSCPTVLLCMIVAALFMELYFYFEDMTIEAYDADPSTLNNVLSYLPSIVYSVVIFLSNMSYRPLAHRLTSFENHRTETQHLNHLVLKILVFDSFNSFGALFYVAFWMRDMQRLRSDLASLLIMNQILEQLQETLMPYISVWKAKRRFRAGGKKSEKRLELLHRQNVPVDEAKLIQAETEADMPAYEGTFDDYLELFLHFGYISLFSCVYPAASLWAFANNMIETRTDGFKFTVVHQRPFPTAAASIGVWQLAFEIMGVLAIVTNVSLIGMSADFKNTFDGLFDQWQIFMLLVFVEHVLVFLKFVVAQVIPDWPEDIRNAMHKDNYESQAAFKINLRKKVQ